MAGQFTDKTIYMGYGQIIYRYNDIYWDMVEQFGDKLYIWDMARQCTDKTIYMEYGRTIYR
jgi:hypothetical protein